MVGSCCCRCGCVIRHLFAFHSRLPGQIRLSGSKSVNPMQLSRSSHDLTRSLPLSLFRSRSVALCCTWATKRPFGKLQLFDKFESFVIDTNSFQIVHTNEHTHTHTHTQIGTRQSGLGRGVGGLGGMQARTVIAVAGGCNCCN